MEQPVDGTLSQLLPGVITSKVNLLQRLDTVLFWGLCESKRNFLNIGKMEFVTLIR